MKREIERVPVARYRLSPNEEARLLKEERDKKKKQRLLVVRQQAKQNSKNVLKDVKAEKQRQIQILAEEIKENFELDKESRLQQLEELYEKNLKQVGEAHVAAVQEDVDGKQEDRLVVQQEDARVKLERGKVALEKLKTDLMKREMEETRQIRARQDAVEKEKERSAYIASKPPPEKDPVDGLQIASMKPVKFTDHDAFATSHYHIPAEYGVVKEDQTTQDNAKETAEQEGERYEDLEAEKKRVENERREKARVRHKVALEKERLNLDYGNILHELSDLQKSDRIRRQKVVANLPKQIFVPPSNRLDELDDQQKGMERAFEDMFIAGQPSVVKDLILDCPPVPAATASDVSSLTTLDESVPRAPPTQLGKDITSSAGESTVRQILDSSNKPPDSGLKSLLGKIKSQREAWVRSSNGLAALKSADHSLTQYTEEETASRTGSQQVTERSEVGTISTGEADSGSTVSTKSQSLVESGGRSVEEGTVTSSGTFTDSRPTHSDTDYHTLNHPLEKAAQLRQSQNGISQQLTKERLQQDQISRENQAIKQDAENRRQHLETKKQELENKLRDLEMKRLALHSRSQEASISRSTHIPPPPPSQKVVPPSGVGILPVNESSHFDTTQSSSVMTGPASSVDIGRVREYQDKLMRRHGNPQEQMQQARQDLQRRVDEMLAKAKSDYDSGGSTLQGSSNTFQAGSSGASLVSSSNPSSQLPTFPRVSPLPETSPLGYFKDISPRLSGMHEDRNIYGRSEQAEPGFENRNDMENRGRATTLTMNSGSDLAHGGSRSFVDEQSLHRKVLEEQVAGNLANQQTPQIMYENSKNSYPIEYSAGTHGSSMSRNGLNSGELVPGIPSAAYHSLPGTATSSLRSAQTDQNMAPLSARTDPFSARTDPYNAQTDPFSAQTDPVSVRTDHSKNFMSAQTNNQLSLGTDHFNTQIDPLSARTDHTINTMSALTGPLSARTDLTSDLFSARADDPLSARTDPLSARTDPLSARTDESVDPLSGISGLPDYKDLEIPETQTLTSRDQSSRFEPMSSLYTPEPRERAETYLYVGQGSDRGQSSEDNKFSQMSQMQIDLQPPTYGTEPTNQTPSLQPSVPPTYDFERRDLSTILEVDSPEKTALSRMSAIGEQQSELSSVGIPESSPVWKDKPTDRLGTQFTPLVSMTADDESQSPRMYADDITMGTTLETQSVTSDTSKQPRPTRNWHEILAENSQSSSVDHQPYSELTRGIPVGESEPVSSGLSQFRQDIVIGAEEDSTSINRLVPVSSSGFVPLMSNETDNTFASTIPDDLPTDRNAFLELQECSPDEKEFNKPAPYMRPLSSTPARKDVPAATNVTDLRKATLMSSKGPEPVPNITIPTTNSRFSDVMPSGIFSQQGSSMATTLQTPSTLKTTQEMSQYTLGSGSSSETGSRGRRGEEVSTDNDLTQYTTGITSQLPTGLTMTTTPAAGTSTGFSTQYGSQLTDPAQAARTSDVNEFSLSQYSVNNTNRSQFEPMSAEYSSKFEPMSADYTSKFEPMSTDYTSKDSHSSSVAGSGSESMFSDEASGTAQDPKIPVVRFASGDPDVRMMSASSSEVGQPMTSQGHLGYTMPGFGLASTGMFTGSLKDSSRPTTIGENREEIDVGVGQMPSIGESSGLMSSIGETSGQLSSMSSGRPLDDLTRRIEETMRKHERLLEESKRMSDRHEEDRKQFTSQLPGGSSELEFTQETGITDEPDLTLLSATSDNLSRHGYNDSNGKITDTSLLSFEQHEKSLVLTPSDHTGDIKTGDASTSLLSFEKHERSIGSSQEGSNGYDRIFGLRKTSPTPLEGSSPPLFLPLSSEPTQPSQQTTLFTSTTTDIDPSLSPGNHVALDTLSSAGSDTTLTPRPGVCEWERDEFTPLRMEEATQEEEGEGEAGDNRGFEPSHGIISIPVGKVDDASEDSVAGLSLQEVFARKKGHLIRNSQERQQSAKVKAKQGTQDQGHMTKTMSQWKKNRGLGKGAKPTKIPSPTKNTHKSTEDRKREEREMKQRTSRLYNQLEDVKDKKQESDRKQSYAANRERAREYTKKLQESRMKKK